MTSFDIIQLAVPNILGVLVRFYEWNWELVMVDTVAMVLDDYR